METLMRMWRDMQLRLPVFLQKGLPNTAKRYAHTPFGSGNHRLYCECFLGCYGSQLTASESVRDAARVAAYQTLTTALRHASGPWTKMKDLTTSAVVDQEYLGLAYVPF
jgi:hypothetical protein